MYTKIKWISFFSDPSLDANLAIQISKTRDIVFTASFGAGFFVDGDGKKLGNNIEFRTTFELSYELKNENRIGISFGHISNANIGDKTNVGAGTITCNYDGINKHKTSIGEDSFIGTNSSLVAPVNIGKGAYVGAGSVITKDVPAFALVVGNPGRIIGAVDKKGNRID